MKKLLGPLLIIGALALGYVGYTKLEDNSAKLKLGDLEISAQDKDSKNEAYIFFGIAAVALIGGIMMSRGKS